jgi:hypothetical protein
VYDLDGNEIQRKLGGKRIVSNQDRARRMRITITDEETGEELAIAGGVETLVLLVAPDTLGTRSYRRILLGDAETSAELLFDILHDVTERVRQGTTIDLSDAIDDRLLLDMTDGLILH